MNYETVVLIAVVEAAVLLGVMLGASLGWRLTRGLPPIPELPRRIRISGGDDETTNADGKPPKARL